MLMKKKRPLNVVLGTVLAAAMAIPATQAAESGGEGAMAAKVLSLVDPNAVHAPVVTGGEKFKIMLSITTGTAPYTLMKDGRKLGVTKKRTISVAHRASKEET